MLTAEENIALPLELAGAKPDARGSTAYRPVGLRDRLRTARPSFRRPAAARRDRPRARLAADRDVRRRADRQPRLDDGRRDPRAAPPRGRRVGQTTVMVTHDAHAAAIADRVLFLADGEIVRDLGRSARTRSWRRWRRWRRDDAVALKGLAARKLRAVLTALAIVLGVAMVSGTLILTDTIRGLRRLFATSYENTDAVVAGKEVVENAAYRQRRPSRSAARARSARCPSVAGGGRRDPRPGRRARPRSSGTTARRSPGRALVSGSASAPTSRASTR